MEPPTSTNPRINVILERLLPFSSTTSELRAKQIIFSQGDRSQSIFYLDVGMIKLSMNSKKGKEAVIALLPAPTFFGYEALESSQTSRATNAIAVSDVRIHRIRGKALFQLLSRDNGSCDIVVFSLMRLVTQLQTTLADHMLYSGDERLSRILTSLKKLKAAHKLNQRTSQEDLARMIGLTRQRVNILLKQLRRNGQ
jgi:CRP/FNR family cyclic AMP-dependent transcriptional regulator